MPLIANHKQKAIRGKIEKLNKHYKLARSLTFKYMKKYDFKNQYDLFIIEWKSTHTISPAPSFTSWKNNYRNDLSEHKDNGHGYCSVKGCTLIH